MQFLQWLSRSTNEKALDHQDSNTSTTTTSNQKSNKVNGINNKEADQPKKGLLIVLKSENTKRDHNGSKEGGIKVNYKKYLKLFLFCRKDVARACFYSTINLKSPSCDIDVITRRYFADSYNNSSMKMKKEDVNISKALVVAMVHDPAGSKKVLPISETTTTTNLSTSKTKSNDENCGDGALEKKEKAKTVSRMKELLRWAAAAKSENKGGKFIGRKVLQFRNRGNPKAVISEDLDQFSIESPKISFRWEVESRSTTSSRFSTVSVTSLKNNPNLGLISLSSATNQTQDSDHHCPSAKGNWITTDSEFVVLEL